MQRVHYDADHHAFAELARDFAAKEVAPTIASWESDGIIPREVFAHAGAVGLLGFAADELVTHCRSHLAGYKTPKQVFFVDTLQKNPSGKLLKRELRTRFGAEQDMFH